MIVALVIVRGMTPKEKQRAKWTLLALLVFILGTVAVGLVAPAPGETTVVTFPPPGQIKDVPDDMAPPSQVPPDADPLKDKPSAGPAEPRRRIIKPSWGDWDQTITHPKHIYDLLWGIAISLNLLAIAWLFYLLQRFGDDRLVRSGATTASARILPYFFAFLAGLAGVLLLGVSVFHFLWG